MKSYPPSPSPRLCLVFLTLALPAAAQDVRNGLVSYWPLDNLTADGLATPDLVAAAPLTLVNMDGENIVPGMKGNALSFNGIDELLFTPTNDGVNPRLPIHNNPRKTICMWVKGQGATQSDRRVFAEASMTTTNTLFGLGTDNANPRTAKLAAFLRTGGGVTLIPQTKTVGAAFDDNWHHIALTDDNGAITFYIDGVLDPTAIRYAWSSQPLNTLSIGAIKRINAPVAFFNGAIDEVALWNRVLSSAEIDNVRLNGLVTPIPPLVSVDRAAPYLQGDRVKLSVQFNAASPVYQWQRNGTAIPGATGSTHVVTALTNATGGEYTVVVNGSVSTPVVLSFTADPAVALASNIVSSWPFDTLNLEAVPATTPDPWGAHALQCVEMDASNLVPGKFGMALAFDGLSEHAQRNSGFAVGANPEFSIAFWVKGNALGQSDSRVFGEGSNTSANPLFTMGTTTDGSPWLQMLVRSDTGTVLLSRQSTGPVFDESWHHVVWAEKAGRVRLYVDGLADETNFDFSRTGQTVSLNQTAIAALQRSGTGNRLKCLVDDVAVWTRALTWSEVQSLVSAAVPAPVTIVAPAVTLDPASRSVWEGRSVTLSAQATGTGPLEYQWLRDNNPVSAATEATLVFDPAVPTQSGTYTLRVRNSAGVATSRPATLTVRPINGVQSGNLSLWPLESGGLTTPDIISSHDFSLVNMDATTAFGPGVNGNAVRFDGANDHMVHTYSGTGADASLTSREEFTVSFWVRGNGIGQLDRRVFAEASTSNSNSLFNMGTDLQGASASLAFYIRGDSGVLPVSQQTTSVMPVFDGSWHHVIYTDYRGQGVLYVDGIQDRTLSYNRPTSTLTNVSIGAIARAAPTHWFNGNMDEVRIWDRALSAAEATTLFSSQPKPITTFAVTGLEVINGQQLSLLVTTSLGAVNYRVQSTTDLASGPWTVVEEASLSGPSNGVLNVVVPFVPIGKRFYRVVVMP